MIVQHQELIKKAYSAFNSRDIDEALSTFTPDVQWPNGWEGGYVQGHEELREYWTRQWKEINPTVDPTGFLQRQDGTVEVAVHQHVKDLKGDSMFDGIIKHIYTIEDGLIVRMEIEK